MLASLLYFCGIIDLYFEKINYILEQNKAKRMQWIDRWNFDEWAQYYDCSVNEEDDELHIFQDYAEIMKKVKETMMINSISSILDIGCGTGSLWANLTAATILMWWFLLMLFII